MRALALIGKVLIGALVALLCLMFVGTQLIVFVIGGFFPTRAAEVLSPDGRYRLEAWTWVRFPANEFLDPAGRVRFEVRKTPDGPVVSSTIWELSERDDFTAPTVKWESGWVSVRDFDVAQDGSSVRLALETAN